MPLTAADLDAHGLVQFPTVVGGIVAVVNIEGIKSGDITLDGPTLARIFLGEIRSWNHAALRKLNPGAKLPSQPIVVVRRSDGSGTTFVFTDYLAKMSREWRSRSGSGPGATKAWSARSRAPRARSATSNTPTPSRTGSPTPR
jgi:phosphate transport system substrate-binding protein